MTVSARIVNHNKVPNVDSRKPSIDGKFVSVFTKRPRQIVKLVVRVLLFASYRDVMIGAIDGRPHEIRHAGVEADVLLVNILDMEHSRYKIPIGPGNDAPTLHVKREGVKAAGSNQPVVAGTDAVADVQKIDGGLFWFVGDPNPAANVDKVDAKVQLFPRLDRQIEHHLRSSDEILRIQLIGRQKRVEPEVFRSLGLKFAKTLKDLGPRKTIFRLFRLPHDETAFTQLAGVITKRNDLGYSAAPVQKVDVADVVEIDGGVKRSRSINSSAGVSFEENMISSPTMPAFSARINSGNELQSAPNPSE